MMEIEPLSVTYYAIRKIGTDLFFPRPHGPGSTWLEPTPWTITAPRLFTDEAAAGNALTWWLKGKWSYIGDEGDLQCISVRSRRRKDFEIVRIKILVEEVISAQLLP